MMVFRFQFALLIALALTLTAPRDAAACTNFIVTPGASDDGGSYITYAADSHELYGDLLFTPARDFPAGATREIIEWDTQKRLGRIPQVPHVYRVIGNINEHQVAVGETTFGGREELRDPNGGLDYGSLMWIALERAKTAREAIDVMTSLVAEHGYMSGGETFSIADPKEAWMLQMIGRGLSGLKGADEAGGSKDQTQHGAIWLACKVPDGYVAVHANQPRMRKLKMPGTTCIHSKDVIQFARDKGYFDGADADFDWVKAYGPLEWAGARFGEARAWSFFLRVAPKHPALQGIDFDGEDRTKVAAIPPWIKPEKKVSLQDVMGYMRDHFEGTALDLSTGVGAGPYATPYRWRPLTWEHEGVKYFNERATATQQTGFSFIAQLRRSVPDPLGVIWFSVDDAASSVYVPMYAGIRSAPHAFAVGTADFETFSWDSAFWLFNAVAAQAYARYVDVIVDIRDVQQSLEGSFIAKQAEIEKTARTLYKKDPGQARDYVHGISHGLSKQVMERWKALWTELFVKYMDGNVRDSQGHVTHPAYPKAWREQVSSQPAKKRDLGFGKRIAHAHACH
jgi:dipeptidase